MPMCLDFFPHINNQQESYFLFFVHVSKSAHAVKYFILYVYHSDG